MAWITDTYKKAREAATEAYDHVYPQQMNAAYRKLPKDRESAIRELTNRYLPYIQSEYPEKSYTPKMAAELAESKVGDWVDYGETENRQFSPRYKAEQKVLRSTRILSTTRSGSAWTSTSLTRKCPNLASIRTTRSR